MVTKIYNEIQKGLCRSMDYYDDLDIGYAFNDVEITVSEGIEIRCRYTHSLRGIGYECQFTFNGDNYGVFSEESGKAEAFKNYNETIAQYHVGNSASICSELFDTCLKAALKDCLK